MFRQGSCPMGAGGRGPPLSLTGAGVAGVGPKGEGRGLSLAPTESNVAYSTYGMKSFRR